jgi:hypothetical protein
MTGSLLRALVTWIRWLLARPAARATGLAPPAGFRCFRAGRSRSFLERACHADWMVLGSSGSTRHWSRSALVSAGSALVALGPFLSALVTRTSWYSARPVARATGLAPPAGFRWFRAGRSRSFLERACHADRLVLGSSGSSRHWSRSALVFAVCACCTTQSPGGSPLGLAPTSPVPLSPHTRAQILLEFGYSRQFHTRGHSVLTVPRVR